MSRPATANGKCVSMTFEPRFLNALRYIPDLQTWIPLRCKTQLVLNSDGSSRLEMAFADGNIAILYWASPDGLRRPKFWKTDPRSGWLTGGFIDGQDLCEVLYANKDSLDQHAVCFRNILDWIILERNFKTSNLEWYLSENTHVIFDISEQIRYPSPRLTRAPTDGNWSSMQFKWTWVKVNHYAEWSREWTPLWCKTQLTLNSDGSSSLNIVFLRDGHAAFLQLGSPDGRRRPKINKIHSRTNLLTKEILDGQELHDALYADKCKLHWYASKCRTVLDWLLRKGDSTLEWPLQNNMRVKFTLVKQTRNPSPRPPQTQVPQQSSTPQRPKKHVSFKSETSSQGSQDTASSKAVSRPAIIHSDAERTTFAHVTLKVPLRVKRSITPVRVNVQLSLYSNGCTYLSLVYEDGNAAGIWWYSAKRKQHLQQHSTPDPKSNKPTRELFEGKDLAETVLGDTVNLEKHALRCRKMLDQELSTGQTPRSLKYLTPTVPAHEQYLGRPLGVDLEK